MLLLSHIYQSNLYFNAHNLTHNHTQPARSPHTPSNRPRKRNLQHGRYFLPPPTKKHHLFTNTWFGFIVITLRETPKIGEPFKITGVAAVVRGNSREEVLEGVKPNPYYVNGIWDPSKVGLMF